MKLALICALGLGACGGSPRPVEPLHQSGGDDRLIIASLELRGVSEPQRAAVIAIAGAHLAAGSELTAKLHDTAHKAILDHYYDRGHVNVQLSWPEALEHAKGKTPIVLTIDEGPVFTIKKLDVKDVADADRARYLALTTLSAGDVFVRSRLAAWLQAVGDAAPGKPIVVPQTTVDLENSTIEIALSLKNP